MGREGKVKQLVRRPGSPANSRCENKCPRAETKESAELAKKRKRGEMRVSFRLHKQCGEKARA